MKRRQGDKEETGVVSSLNPAGMRVTRKEETKETTYTPVLFFTPGVIFMYHFFHTGGVSCLRLLFGLEAAPQLDLKRRQGGVSPSVSSIFCLLFGRVK